MSKWELRTTDRFEREMRKVDHSIAGRIKVYLEDLILFENPRGKGKALTADRAGVWRYRVGDYRILVEIHDNELIVLAISVGHQSRIYRD